mmetsp:Transcript_4999/g.19980  ORF Transcript_4999/g.19980 Transcript_4999/m.19980 type:complete len:341 (+) Transcript_4999:65-1087(+)
MPLQMTGEGRVAVSGSLELLFVLLANQYLHGSKRLRRRRAALHITVSKNEASKAAASAATSLRCMAAARSWPSSVQLEGDSPDTVPSRRSADDTQRLVRRRRRPLPKEEKAEDADRHYYRSGDDGFRRGKDALGHGAEDEPTRVEHVFLPLCKLSLLKCLLVQLLLQRLVLLPKALPLRVEGAAHAHSLFEHLLKAVGHLLERGGHFLKLLAGLEELALRVEQLRPQISISHGLVGLRRLHFLDLRQQLLLPLPQQVPLNPIVLPVAGQVDGFQVGHGVGGPPRRGEARHAHGLLQGRGSSACKGRKDGRSQHHSPSGLRLPPRSSKGAQDPRGAPSAAS